MRASFLDKKQEIENFGTDSKKGIDKQRKEIYNQDIKEMEPIPKKKNTSGESYRREGGPDMDYAKIAVQVIEHVGGKDNILSAAHCATRLRLQLKNNDLRNEEALTDVEGVKGVFLTQSQFQIIFGSGLVNLIFAEVQKQIGADGDAEADETRKKRENGEIRCRALLSC